MEPSGDLRLAREAIQSGDKDAARKHLFRAIRADPQSEQAWLWLSAVIDDPDKERDCLERALRINPDNRVARDHLEKLAQPETPAPRAVEAKTVAEAPKKVNACSVRVLLAVVGIIAFFVIMAVVMSGIIGGSKDEGTVGGAMVTCEDAVHARLVAPSTAKFSPIAETTVWKTNQPGDNWGVLGYVDAQNRFGATLRMHYLCVARYDGAGRWTITEFEFTDG